MSPFVWQWRRLAWSRNRGGVIRFGSAEEWRHVAFGFWWRTTP